MTIKEIKEILNKQENISFQLPNGELVPSHFHVTEVGVISKHFIDCGGKERIETVANFQLWEANDYDHRLHPEKLVNIIELSQKKINIGDHLDIEVEYQGTTIGKYNLEFVNGAFQLMNKQTACLALDACGIEEKPMIDLTNMTESNSCTPGGGCC